MNSRTHLAVKALIQRDGKYLILEATYGPQKTEYHDLPGGRIQEGENPISALSREILEETGLEQVCIGELLGTWQFKRMNGDLVNCATYICSTISDQVITTHNPDTIEDITGFLWLTKEELLESKLFQDDSIFDIFRKLSS